MISTLPLPVNFLHEHPPFSQNHADKPRNRNMQITFHICLLHAPVHPFPPIPQTQTIYFCTRHQEKHTLQFHHIWTDVTLVFAFAPVANVLLGVHLDVFDVT